MYKKTVKRGDKEYSYYYTNIRKDGKVRNIFLSSNKEEAVHLENEIKNDHTNKSYPSQPKERTFGGANTLFLFLGILFISGLLFYFFSGITGFAVIDNNIIELNVDKQVDIDSIVFLTVNLDEYKKPISDFNLEEVDGKYKVDTLKVDINDFNLNISEGAHTFFLSLIDNGELVAIKSQDITISENKKPIVEIIEENITEEPVIEIIEENVIVINDTLQEDNITLQEDIILPEEVVLQERIENVSFKEKIIIGKPVKWIRTIKLNQSLNNLTVDIPKEAKKLKVNEIKDGNKLSILDKVKVEDNGNIKPVESTNLITGGIVVDWSRLGSWFKGITGFAVVEEGKIITLQIEGQVEEVEIEYETPGPYAVEIDLNNGKRVTIGSEVEGYTDVLAYTYLDRENCDSAVVHWVNENKNVEHICNDEGDNLYIEWDVPHLSNQVFDVYIGQPFSFQNITDAGVYVNTEAIVNYRNYTVARTNYTLYCNNLTTDIPVLSYEWYKNDAALGSNTSSLTPNNFVKGDYLFCQINGINSTDRYILDTTLGDFMNGTMAQVNRTGQPGNITLANNTNGNGYYLTGNYTSMIFDLGSYPNMSLISWGSNIPSYQYYYRNKELVFGWNGEDKDSYVSSHTGTLLGGVLEGNANGTGALPNKNSTIFDGIDDGINYGTVAYNLTNFTISVWARYDKSFVPASVIQIFDARGSNGNRLSYGQGGNSNIEFRGETGSSAVITVAQDLATTNQWHMYTMLFDSTYGAFLYRDGIEIGSDLTVGYVTTAQANFNIGKSGFATVEKRNWTGAIDELHIWNGTLNANEINNLYLNGLNQVKMQSRMGNNLTSQTNWGEWGNTTSIGVNATYANSTGENINYTYNGSNNRYIQYRAFLETIDANYTPSLYDVVMKQVDYKVRIFNYEPLSNFSLSYPGNNTWINNNHTSLNWTNQSDLDNDDLYSWLQVYNITDSLIINVSLYNKTELPFGVGVHESLYGLNFGWNGRSKDDYVNDLTGTLNGGVGVGDSQSLFPDNNATTFDGMDDYIYYSLSMNNGTTYSAWFNYQHKTGFESYSGKNCVLDTGQIEMCISKEGKLEVSGVNITAQNWDNRGQLGTNTFVRSLTVWNGSLYGGSGSGSDSGIVYRYSGSSWIDTGQLGTDDNVLALTVWNGSLYGGTISSGNVYRYSGSSWIDTGQLGTNTRVYSLAVWNGSLYGGTYISGKVYRYSGSSWIDTGQLGTSTFIHSLAVWNGSLYGGSGSDSGKVYRYNETGWIDTGQLGTNTDVYSLVVWNGSLYGGSGSGKVYRYNETGWIDTGQLGTNTHVYSLAVWNGSLYGGSGSDSGEVYRYNETGWINTGQLGTNVRVYSLAVWNGSLYGGTSVSGNVYRYGDSGLTLTNEINNEWNHAAVTLDGNNMYLYLNGQLVQQGTYKQYVPVSSINVGTRAGSSGAGLNGELFNGTLDEVHIWNRSLNADEVSLLYYSGIGLMDGNYTWRVRTIDNSTINDNNYESAYSDWSDYFEFYLDSQAPTAAVHNITINRTIGEVIVNESSPVVTGENITLRFNITDAGFGVNSAWIKIWQTVKDGIMLFFGWLIHVTGDIWEITLPAVNYTYAPGQVNYTIYANDTINNTVEYDDSFYVEYNTTLDSFFNYYTVEYGDNVTIIINYNYTNSSAIMGSFVNATISNVLYTATYDSRGFYYNDTIGYYDINLGNYVVSVNASRNSQYYTFRNNLTHLAVQDTIAPNLTNANATLLGFSGNSIAPWNITKINVTAQDRHSINKSIVQVNTPGFNYFNISMIKNGNEYYTEYNLSSNVTEAGTFTFFFLFNDNSSNWNNTVNYSVYVNDSTFPTIDNVNKTPEPSYLSSNVTLNATIYDMFLYEVWLEGNWSGSWVNYTNSSGAFYINSNTYYYNISFGNFSHRQNVAYRWWANDTLGNTNVSSWQEFYVNNRAPTIAVWRYPTMNTHMLYDNFTIFDWDNSTDYDLDNMSYELELYNNTAFNSTYLIFAFNSSFSNYTLLAASMPPVGDYYIRYRANDSLIYNEYNYTNFSVVYAILQIVSPSYDQILKVGSSYFFNVTESGNGDWVSNVSLEIKGATFTNYINLTNYTAQFDYTSYNATYAVPSVVSQYVDIIAYSWNGSIGSSTNNSDTSRFRIPNAITGVPQIDYFCPGRTYVTQEQVNITVRTQMNDVLVELVNASIVSPGGDTVILNSTSSNINNYINNDYNFEYNFTYTPIAEGEHQLRIEVRDVNFNDTGATANKTIPLIVSNITNISFTSNGISNFTIKDICSNEIIIYSNASVSISEVPGVYNLEFIQDKLTVLVSNATLDGNEGEICDYDDISETLSVPTDTRAVDQINVSCYNLNYGWSNNNVSVNMTYNYTNILQRITHEENLDAYKCYSIESCTWSQLTSSSVTSDQNKIEFATNNFSVFMVAEDVTVTTVTVSAPGSGGGGGGGGGGSDQGVDLDIIEPGVLEIGEGSVFTTTVILKNPWTQPLYGIQLSAVSSEENLEFSFDTNYILELLPGAQMSVILTVKKIGDILGEDFDINVIANVASPDFIDSSKIAITSFGEGIKTQSARQIDFVERLFVQNPACKELYELVKKSKASFDKGDYETAIKLSEGAVNSCESLLTSLGLKIQKPKGKILTDNVIIGIEILVFLFVFYGLYYYYRRRRFKNKKI